MYPTTEPLGKIARPATEPLRARLARVNQGGSGITAGMQANGTPFLTNRPEFVDELPDEVVNQVVSGGEMNVGPTSVRDPRALMKQFIVAQDNTGRANATNRDFDLEAPALHNKLRAQGMTRQFEREQKRADVNEQAATAFDPNVARLADIEAEQARELANIKNAGPFAQAEADRYVADANYDAKAFEATTAADASDFSSILRSYGDALSGGLGSDPAAREQALAPIRSLIIRLLQGQANANQQP